jgi:hypothetical protein
MVDETGQPYAYTGDDPVNGVDPLGLCRTEGTFLVPRVCDFTSRSWVAQVEGGFQLQKTQAMEGGWSKFRGGVEDFADTLTDNPLAYCGPGSGDEVGLADTLDFGAGLGSGNPEVDADDETADTDSALASSGGGPGTPRLGQPSDASWPIQTGGNCLECAAQIQGRIGGEIETIEPPTGAESLGPSSNNSDGDWQYHTFVVKNGYAFDGFTGPQGIPIAEYVQQFEYGDDSNITPGGPSR